MSGGGKRHRILHGALPDRPRGHTAQLRSESVGNTETVRDSPQIRALDPVVKHLYQARSAAIRAYQLIHTQKAAQSGVQTLPNLPPLFVRQARRGCDTYSLPIWCRDNSRDVVTG
jgi:hypothetical protein